MNKKCLIGAAIICLFGCLFSVNGAAGDKVELLLTGQFHGDEVTAGSGDEWFGVFPLEDGFELSPAVVSIRPCMDAIIDDEGEKTGKKVSTDKPVEPLFIVRGVKGLKHGRVKTVFVGSLIMTPDTQTSLSLDGKDDYYLSALARNRTKEGYAEDYKLELSYNGETQVLASFPKYDIDGTPKLLWAGDLDRDGKPDLLMDLTDHYNRSVYTILLSSMAGRGEFVKKAAVFSTTGC